MLIEQDSGTAGQRTYCAGEWVAGDRNHAGLRCFFSARICTSRCASLLWTMVFPAALKVMLQSLHADWQALHRTGSTSSKPTTGAHTELSETLGFCEWCCFLHIPCISICEQHCSFHAAKFTFTKQQSTTHPWHHHRQENWLSLPNWDMAASTGFLNSESSHSHRLCLHPQAPL